MGDSEVGWGVHRDTQEPGPCCHAPGSLPLCPWPACPQSGSRKAGRRWVGLLRAGSRAPDTPHWPRPAGGLPSAFLPWERCGQEDVVADVSGLISSLAPEPSTSPRDGRRSLHGTRESLLQISFGPQEMWPNTHHSQALSPGPPACLRPPVSQRRVSEPTSPAQEV